MPIAKCAAKPLALPDCQCASGTRDIIVLINHRLRNLSLDANQIAAGIRRPFIDGRHDPFWSSRRALAGWRCAKPLQLRLALRQQPRRRRLDVAPQPLEEGVLVEPGRDRHGTDKNDVCADAGFQGQSANLVLNLRFTANDPSRLLASISCCGSEGRADYGVVADELEGKLIKIGAKVVSDGRCVIFQMAEVAIPRQMFQQILRLIAVRPQPPPAGMRRWCLCSSRATHSRNASRCQQEWPDQPLSHRLYVATTGRLIITFMACCRAG